MSRVFTEVAANANFTTGVTCPTPGEAGSIWWNEYEALFQQHSDRTQALALSVGFNGTNQITRSIGLDAFSLGSRWNLLGLSTNFYYLQTSNTDGGALWFAVDPLPVGAKLVSITARLAGGAPFSGSFSHSGLPGTMPSLVLYRQTDGTSTTVGTQADTSGTTGAYDAFHSVTLAASHTIVSGAHYNVKITGEAGTNSSASVLTMAGLSMVIGFS